MEYETPEITMNDELRLRALKPIERMLEISRAAGLIG
jgi:quinolinate synthase